MNFSKEERIAFKEVNEIIKIMGLSYKNEIPNNLLKLLDKEQEKDYVTKIRKDLPFKKQQITRIALVLLNYINTNYWLKDENLRQELKQVIKNKEEDYQKILREKYNPNEIFRRREKN